MPRNAASESRVALVCAVVELSMNQGNSLEELWRIRRRSRLERTASEYSRKYRNDVARYSGTKWVRSCHPLYNTGTSERMHGSIL